jgi:hypothetical protein
MVATSVAKTASKAGSIGMVVVLVQEREQEYGGQPFVVSTGGRSCDVEGRLEEGVNVGKEDREEAK